MSDYRDLKIWQKAMEICLEIYRVSETFPSTEKFGLTSQIRRSAVSLPSNIAEGRYRSSKKDFRNFLYITKGSAAELQTQIEIVRRLGYLNKSDASALDQQLLELLKMLSAFISSMA